LPEEARLLRFSNTWEAMGQLSKIKFLGGVFLKGKAVENAGEQKLPSHVFCTSKGRRRRTVSFKTTPFWVLFF
jgi:hypothetical protein